MASPVLFVVAGTPGSGKDELIRAVADLGDQHAQIVPKHTSRARQDDDGVEMICPGDSGYALDDCDLIYSNFDTKYGVQTPIVWQGLQAGRSQLLVVSDVEAMTKLRRQFGEVARLLYVHSVLTEDDFVRQAERHAYGKDYLEPRVAKYWSAFDVYVKNIAYFDHVLIHAGADEDLYDQIFRLFRAYERGDIHLG